MNYTYYILGKKAGRKIFSGEIISVPVDRVVSHDNTTTLAIDAFRKLSEKVFNPNKIFIFFDHCYPAANQIVADNQKRIRKFVKEQGIKHFYREGVCHQVMLEKGRLQSGQIVIGADSHTCTYGCKSLFATGMGSTDIGVIYATGRIWLKVPEVIGVEITGKLKKGVYAKDIILYLCSVLGSAGANYQSIEFFGETIEKMKECDKATLCNMAIEMGAKNGIVYPGTPKKKDYKKIITINISKLNPQIAYPHSPSNVKDAKEFEGINVDEIFIGTCTNGRIEDLEVAADILKGKKVSENTRLIIVPASKSIYEKCLKRKYLKIFNDAGAIVCNAGCGPCIGRHQGVLAKGETALTTMNRNFKGRMGSPYSKIYLASPAVCAMSAITGKITTL